MMEAHAGSVLVVEDERPIRMLLLDGLSVEGFSVTTVCDGREALQSLEDSQPAVVLLDLMLPGIDGLAPATEIHRRWPVSIIAMSASRAMLAMADRLPYVWDAISKPFDSDVLVTDLQLCMA